MKTLILILIVYTSLLLSNTQAQQWKVWNSDNSNLPQGTVLVSLQIVNNEIWLGSNNGLLKFNGNNFIVYDTINSPLKSNNVLSIAKDRVNNLWLATLKQGFGNEAAVMKFNRFNSWEYFNSQNSSIYTGNQFCIAVDTNNIVWSFYFKLSKYNGINWQTFDTTNSPLKFSGGWEIFVDKANNKWIAQDFQGVYKFTDDSIWTNYNLSNSNIAGTEVKKIKQDKEGNIWTTSIFGGLSRFNADSNTWQKWTPENSNLNSAHPRGLYIDKNNRKWIGLSSGNGVAEFDDILFTYYYPPIIESLTIYDIKDDYLSNLWLATSRGLMQFNKNGIVGINNNVSALINNFIIEKIYPNPFNPKTKIVFSLNETSNIQIKVYDLKGSVLKNISFNKLVAGNHAYELDMNSQSSGIYFIVFYQNNNLIATKKISLIK